MYCFTPRIPGKPVGSSSCFRFDGISKPPACLASCSAGDEAPEVWMLLSKNSHRWEPVCSTVGNEMESVAQWDYCARERACFYCGGMCCPFLKKKKKKEKGSLDFRGVFRTPSLWKGSCVSAAFGSVHLASSPSSPSGVQAVHLLMLR